MKWIEREHDAIRKKSQNILLNKRLLRNKLGKPYAVEFWHNLEISLSIFFILLNFYTFYSYWYIYTENVVLIFSYMSNEREKINKYLYDDLKWKKIN